MFPSEGWLDFVKTNAAKNHIRKALLRKNTEFKKEDLISSGKATLLESLTEEKIDVKEFLKKVVENKLLESYNYHELDELYLAIANRNISMNALIDKITNKKQNYFSQMSDFTTKRNISQMPSSSKSGIVVKGIDNISVTVAQCCSPIPGDDIVGYISKGMGVKVHRKDCSNIKNETKRLLEVEWDITSPSLGLHTIDISVKSSDRPNLLVDVMNVLGQNKVSVKNVSANLNPTNLTANIALTLLVTDVKHLTDVMNTIKNITGVFEVNRSSKN